MTVEFMGFTDLFEVKRDRQKEYLWDFSRYVSPELHPQLKGFYSVHLFCCNYFIKIVTREYFCPSL